MIYVELMLQSMETGQVELVTIKLKDLNTIMNFYKNALKSFNIKITNARFIETE